MSSDGESLLRRHRAEQPLHRAPVAARVEQVVEGGRALPVPGGRVLFGHLPQERSELLEGGEAVHVQQVVADLGEQVRRLGERHGMGGVHQLAPQPAQHAQAVVGQRGLGGLVPKSLQPIRRDLDPRRAFRRRQRRPGQVHLGGQAGAARLRRRTTLGRLGVLRHDALDGRRLHVLEPRLPQERDQVVLALVHAREADREDLQQAGQLLGAEALAEGQRPDAVAVHPEGHAVLAVAVEVDGLVLEFHLEGMDGQLDLALGLQDRDEAVEEGGQEAVDRLVPDVIEEEGAGGRGEPRQSYATRGSADPVLGLLLAAFGRLARAQPAAPSAHCLCSPLRSSRACRWFARHPRVGRFYQRRRRCSGRLRLCSPRGYPSLALTAGTPPIGPEVVLKALAASTGRTRAWWSTGPRR